MTPDFRTLKPEEKKLLDHLLEGDFPGREVLTEQVKSSVVRNIDENGSLEFQVASDSTAPVKFRIPAEGEAQDSDGATIHVLLHVVNGKIHELEVYKEDSSPVISPPNPSEFRLFRPE